MIYSDIVIERTLEEAKYILDNRCTIRECAKAKGVSKTTVYRDLTKRLPSIDRLLHFRVYTHLRNNWNARTMRGGISTSRKYKEIREDKC